MDFKNRMIEAVERGETTEDGAYEYVREASLDAADHAYKVAKENGYRNPLVAPMFCTSCHRGESSHPHAECETFTPGSEEAVREENRRKGF